MRSEIIIIDDIKNFEPTNNDWLELDKLLSELWEHTPSIEWVDLLLEIFDRYPEEDGNGVFWSIVHGLETINGYELILKKSYLM